MRNGCQHERQGLNGSAFPCAMLDCPDGTVENFLIVEEPFALPEPKITHYVRQHICLGAHIWVAVKLPPLDINCLRSAVR